MTSDENGNSNATTPPSDIGARVRAATWSSAEPGFERLLATVLLAMAAAAVLAAVAFLTVSTVRTASPWLLLLVPAALLSPGRHRAGRRGRPS